MDFYAIKRKVIKDDGYEVEAFREDIKLACMDECGFTEQQTHLLLDAISFKPDFPSAWLAEDVQNAMYKIRSAMNMEVCKQ